jgi:hypothetical protein
MLEPGHKPKVLQLGPVEARFTKYLHDGKQLDTDADKACQDMTEVVR